MSIANRTPATTSLGLLTLLGAAWASSSAAQQLPGATPGPAAEELLYGSPVAPQPGPIAAPLESAESLSVRVRAARRVAVERRRAALAMAPLTKGASQSELEIRGAERNLAIYDLQVLRGEANPATKAFRKLTLSTLADARRKELWRVWGTALYHPEAFDLLSEHGRTLAQLRRIQLLARAKGLHQLVTKADEVMRQADLVFEHEMARMRDEIRDNPSFARLSVELSRQAEREAKQ